jgi:hypothetical protein
MQTSGGGGGGGGGGADIWAMVMVVLGCYLLILFLVICGFLLSPDPPMLSAFVCVCVSFFACVFISTINSGNIKRTKISATNRHYAGTI